ncbi:[Pyruvate dehydrogenase (acetyl-transferring)] kinase isozyme 2, mitochondrial [Amphibalanus amphitrite]|uniref:Protein-serine/threonine kinase n=1 Tax=Amphibalanus amphitrite TaxID=1232801 RepID=A0A6A4VX24_AMPAM|nr:pyruvate dehydrogenase (acetyl-transferring) kinase, mitochondrial-like [Amphibalanus amphitrite]KAF0293931.1 [Pyruvate dehydrogenase (acetyl-transferring)] kinase isozyme 2, mitochondrial [Amphibalanus amphitrite]
MKFSRCFRGLAQMLDTYSGYKPSPLSIKQFIDFGTTASERQSFQFLRQELPVRLANIMMEIQLLPESLLSQPSCRRVVDWYQQSFSELLQFCAANPESSAARDDFCESLVNIRNRHSDVVQTMAKGVIELKDSTRVDCSTENNIQYFLDRFYMNRISIRMLINQHTLLFGSGLGGDPRHIGCIDPYCDVVEVIKDAAASARFLCERYYLACPELVVSQFNETFQRSNKHTDALPPPMQLTYVPSHLYHMLFELLKNAMRAVVENHPAGAELPPIQLYVILGGEDLVIKICDRGGGVSRATSERLFQYLYSTAPRPPQDPSTPPLAGYGYGLPLSRLYARYFQGDLVINSCEGYGTDATIFLKALAQDMKEVLPLYNRAAQQHYQNGSQAPDWSSVLGSSGARPRSTPTDSPPKPASSTARKPSRPASAAVSSLRNISTGSAASGQGQKAA